MGLDELNLDANPHDLVREAADRHLKKESAGYVLARYALTANEHPIQDEYAVRALELLTDPDTGPEHQPPLTAELHGAAIRLLDWKAEKGSSGSFAYQNFLLSAIIDHGSRGM